jgi:hypothetical protein
MTGISAIPSAVSSATATLQRSSNAMARDAAVVAQPGVASKELVQALIDSRQQVLYSSAAAKLISASDQMQQSLIDILA